MRAIEQESLAKLPEAAYVRGFVRSYARVLNLDPAPLLADLGLKLTPAADSVVDGMVQARDYSPVRAAAREHASRKIVMAGAVLLLIALGALGWYATHPPRSRAAVGRDLDRLRRHRRVSGCERSRRMQALQQPPEQARPRRRPLQRRTRLLRRPTRRR